ncbi:hypothetical protein GWI33_003487, partial [Rhynchophorus ferrugineus]
MNQLDPITRASIAAQQASIKLEDLAKIADNIKDSIGSWRPAGGTAPTNSSESQLAEEFARLRLQIHGLQAKVDEVAEHQRASFRNRASSRSSSRGRSSSRSSSRDRSRIRGCELYDGLCWYHYNYAERARRCRPGCRYEKPKRECGKPAGRSLMAASDGHHIMRRLFVKDRNSNQEFLVDTGTDLCVFPRRLVNGHRKKTNYDLTAANGSIIATKLVDRNTRISVNGRQPQYENVASIKLINNSSRYHDILQKFPEITRPDGACKTAPVKHATVHHINTTPGPSVAAKPRRLAPDRLRDAKREFETMLKLGLCRPSQSSWSSPLHMVPK